MEGEAPSANLSSMSLIRPDLNLLNFRLLFLILLQHGLRSGGKPPLVNEKMNE